MKTLRQALLKARTTLVLAAILGVAGTWMVLVASHDPGGPYGESAAAWAQAIMSVGAILAAVVIDQGASRRDRQDRLEVAAAARAARLRGIQLCALALENAADAARNRPLKRGLKFEGIALEAVLSAGRTIRQFADRGSDNDPTLVWVLNRAATEVEAAAEALDRHPLATRADLAHLEQAARTRAQALREILDEYEAGVYDL